MTTAIELKNILHIKKDTDNPLNIFAVIQKGLTKSTALKVKDLLGLTLREFTPLLARSERTFERKKAGESFDPVMTERLIDLARVAVAGSKVFDGPGELKEWLREPNRALNNLRPVDVMNTHVGCGLVRDLLKRTQYGVYS